LRPLPPDNIDYEISIQIARDWWGNGYAGEAGDAIAHYAFDAGTDEVFAVSRPANQRAAAAAAARRMGMDWVGQTDKYYNTRLDVFRFRRYDLDVPAVAAPPEAAQTDELTDI
jgi:RimJ/RimL family protein N-acetyltransferase